MNKATNLSSPKTPRERLALCPYLITLPFRRDAYWPRSLSVGISVSISFARVLSGFAFGITFVFVACLRSLTAPFRA